MIVPTDLPESVPIFPLSGAILLPRARLPLNIFEPRYLAMLADVLKTPQRLIGMVQPLAGHEVGGADSEAQGAPDLHKIGCAGRIIQFSEADDGCHFVTLLGVSRFDYIREIQGATPYRQCLANWKTYGRDLGEFEKDTQFDRPAFLDLLARYFQTKKLQVEWDTLKKADDEMLINSLSMLLELQSGEKQALLEAETLSARRKILETLMDYSLRSGQAEETMQ